MLWKFLKLMKSLTLSSTDKRSDFCMSDFSHIPEKEKKEKWFLLIEPLIKARCSRSNYQTSKLLMVLEKREGLVTWRGVKLVVEIALQHAANSERIFSRASQINTDPDPDGVIDDMFAEARTIPYLLLKGFKNIGYNRREGLDFSAEFANQTYNIEVTYLRGPTFKTQKPVFITEVTNAPVFQLESRKLISRLKTICAAKEKQASKHGGTPSDTIVLVISDLDEMYEPWLKHDKFQGQHPILGLVTSRKFPTVIFVPGTVYEPSASTLDGVFGQLSRFGWSAFERLVGRDTEKGGENVPA